MLQENILYTFLCSYFEIHNEFPFFNNEETNRNSRSSQPIWTHLKWCNKRWFDDKTMGNIFHKIALCKSDQFLWGWNVLWHLAPMSSNSWIKIQKAKPPYITPTNYPERLPTEVFLNPLTAHIHINIKILHNLWVPFSTHWKYVYKNSCKYHRH